MNSTLEYLQNNNILNEDWDIYLKTDSESKESTEGIEQHWIDKVDEKQSHQFVLLREEDIGEQKYLVGLKCYQVKIDLGRGNFERWKKESTVSASTIEGRMRFTKDILWKAGIVKQGKEPRRKQILRGVKFLNSNPLLVKDLCVEIEQEKKEVDSLSQKATHTRIISQDEVDRTGRRYLWLLDERINHFSEMSGEERVKFRESLIQVLTGADERLDHFNILIERRKVKLVDLQLEE